MGTLRNIQEFIRSPIFSSSARVGILLYLMGVEKTSFTDLLKGIGLPKSSLYLHLKVLEENGAISMRETLFRGRPRTVIQITEEGKRMVNEYLNLLEGYVKRGDHESFL